MTAEFSSPIQVGAAQPSPILPLTKYAPVTGNVGSNKNNWQFGGINSYPSPFRSFYQQTQTSMYSLGPYCRKVSDGASGRLKMSLMLGEIGFVQQCWYSFPRGAFDTDSNGDQYDANNVWWSGVNTTFAQVRDLMTSGAPLIWVEVATGGYTENDPNTWSFLAPLSGAVANHVHAAWNLVGGQSVASQIFGGDVGNCGVGSTNGTPDPNTDGGGWVPDLSFLNNGSWGGMDWILGEAANASGVGFNSLSASDQADIGSDLNDTNRSNFFDTALATHKAQLKAFLDELKDDIYGDGTALGEAARLVKIKQLLELLAAAPMAANLMIQAWWLPNLRKYGSNQFNLPDGTSSNPYKWRPPQNVQERWASYFNTTSTGAPNGSDFKAYIPSSTPYKSGTNESDWGWFLTLLNRGDTTSVPFVDPATNEFVFNENYGFGRGGSVSSTDPFINFVQAKTNQQTADSMGVLMDMMPATPFFIATVVPIALLEANAKMIKKKKGDPIGATNLDAYDTTTFQIRISANNMKKGNPTMYNYLLNTGDASGNKFTAVP
jgi:hypothetical protein